MIRLKTFSLFTAWLPTVFLFLFFCSFINAQNSSSLYKIYSPKTDYTNINPYQKDYSNMYSIQRDYSNTYYLQEDYSNKYPIQSNFSNIITPKSVQSNIYAFNRDLIDSHNPSLYESIHSNEYGNIGSLLIVKNIKGKVVSVINLND